MIVSSRCKNAAFPSQMDVTTREEDFEGHESSTAEGQMAAGSSNMPLALIMEAMELCGRCEEDLPDMRFLYANSAAASRLGC